jgi:hypothetical protein
LRITYDIRPDTSNNNKEISQIKRKQLALEGIELVFSLFVTAGQRRLFPRKIMTKYTKGQITAYSKEQVIYWFEQANYEDCRINAYPAFLSEAEEQDYKQGVNLNLFAPNILFIDLDLEHFKSKEELDKWLNKILRNIATILHGVKPFVLWSGHGFHIIIPVKATAALEQFEDFETHTNKLSEEFLQFAKRHLSLNKADSKNNPAFGSCLLRVPYTFNSKCINEKVDPEVTIIQDWDSKQRLTEIDNLLTGFQTFLIDKKIKAETNHKRIITESNGVKNPSNQIQYIEKLLKMQLADYRKFAVSLILAPYFVNIQNLSDTDSFSKMKQWIRRCNELKKVEPSIEYLDDLAKKSIERARYKGIKPLRFKETLRYKCEKLYSMLE